MEAVFGTIKHNMRFREFRLRGRQNVANEWNLVGATFNLKRLQSLMGGFTPTYAVQHPQIS